MKYRLKKTAKNHYVRREDGTVEMAEHGEVVELTEAQAKAFGDKFEPVAKTAPSTTARQKSKPKSDG